MDVTKIKEALKLIKDAFSVQNFTDAKLNDGTTIISYDADKLDVGVAVMAVTEQGKLPLPDGDYILEDGTAFNVASGVVTAVTPVEEKEEAPAGASAQASTPQAQTPMTEATAKTIVESVIRESRFAEDIAELKAELEKFKTANEAFATQKESDNKIVEGLKAELKDSKELMLKAIEVIESIGNEGSDKPAERTGTPAKRKTAKELSSEFRNALK